MTTTMTDFTPGPWEVVELPADDYEEGGVAITGRATEKREQKPLAADRRYVACLNHVGTETTPEESANARLIAAAPEMYAALRLALHYLEHPDVQTMPFALSASVPAERTRALLAAIDGGTA